MEEIQKVNVQIKEEIKIVRKEVKLKCLETRQANPSMEVGSLSIQVQMEAMQLEISAAESNDNYKICIPGREIKDPNSTVDCKGCGSMFKANNWGCNRTLYPEVAYYIHCMNECEAFQKLGLILKCEDCKLLFISSKSFSTHIRIGHRSGSKRYPCMKIPASEQILKLIPILRKKSTQQIMAESNYGHLKTINVGNCNGLVKCPGCQLEFRAKIYSYHQKVYTLDYYVHCMEECEEYRKLGLISECSKCKLKFLNKHSLGIHKAKGKCYRKQWASF